MKRVSTGSDTSVIKPCTATYTNTMMPNTHTRTMTTNTAVNPCISCVSPNENLTEEKCKNSKRPTFENYDPRCWFSVQRFLFTPKHSSLLIL